MRSRGDDGVSFSTRARVRACTRGLFHRYPARVAANLAIFAPALGVNLAAKSQHGITAPSSRGSHRAAGPDLNRPHAREKAAAAAAPPSRSASLLVFFWTSTKAALASCAAYRFGTFRVVGHQFSYVVTRRSSEAPRWERSVGA